MTRYYKLGISDCYKIAKENDGTCLSVEFFGSDNKYLWECRLGHRWYQTYRNIKHGGRGHKGSWCPTCGGSKPLCMDNCHIIAELNGGECLDNIYLNARTKYRWLCSCRYMWDATYDKIKQGQWCPKCAGRPKLCINDCHIVAELNNGQCLDNIYVNAATKYKWMCCEKHVWSASFGNIKNGKWCPECSEGKTQRLLTNIVRNMLKQEVVSNFKDFVWLGIKTNRQEIDIYVPSLKLAIEYDGLQHFRPVCFGGIRKNVALKNFERTQQLDKIKDNKMKEHPDDIKYFIRFSYKEPITKEYVRRKLLDYGIVIQEEEKDE